jgi:H+-translocating NAD(P) transhydrogenase subunit alpha
MPGPASKLYAQNIVNLVTLMTVKHEDGTADFAPDFEDEIVTGCCVTRDGQVWHEPTRNLLEGVVS